MCKLKASLNAHASLSSVAKCLNVGISCFLHPYFVYASSKGSGGSAHMSRLASVFVARHCNRMLAHLQCFIPVCFQARVLMWRTM